MVEEIKKKVDEDWKRRADEERQQIAKKAEAEKPKRQAYPEASFGNIVAWIAAQAVICMGETEDPATKKKERDLAQARYLVDTLMVLKQKTKGNLASEEEKQLEAILYDLQLAFVRAAEQARG